MILPVFYIFFDIFVHFSSIEMEGYKSLKAGQEVFYEVNKGPKGLHAALIKPNEADATPQARTETRVKRESVERETAEA